VSPGAYGDLERREEKKKADLLSTYIISTNFTDMAPNGNSKQKLAADKMETDLVIQCTDLQLGLEPKKFLENCQKIISEARPILAQLPLYQRFANTVVNMIRTVSPTALSNYKNYKSQYHQVLSDLKPAEKQDVPDDDSVITPKNN